MSDSGVSLHSPCSPASTDFSDLLDVCADMQFDDGNFTFYDVPIDFSSENLMSLIPNQFDGAGGIVQNFENPGNEDNQNYQEHFGQNCEQNEQVVNPNNIVYQVSTQEGIESLDEHYKHDNADTIEAMQEEQTDNGQETTNNCLPKIKILVQPTDKFRFRYKSELSGTHGCLSGDTQGSKKKKAFPKVQIENCDKAEAIIRCSLVTVEEPYNNGRWPHPHHLIKKTGDTESDGPHEIEVSKSNNYTAVFDRMGIIHTAKKDMITEIIEKRKKHLLEEKQQKSSESVLHRKEIAEITSDAEKVAKSIDLNKVALCFQGFKKNKNGVLIEITKPVYSRTINNLKSALTGELRITRLDKIWGSCEGGDEIFMLVEKINKKNIRIKFFEDDENNVEIWSENGMFTENDVHHQYAIVFKTPKYKSEIETDKKVFIQLERTSDGETSNIIPFTYKPSKKTINRLKRRRMSDDDTIANEVTSVIESDLPNILNDLSNSKFFAELKKTARKIKDQYQLDDKTLQNYLMREIMQETVLQSDGIDNNGNVFEKNLEEICDLVIDLDLQSVPHILINKIKFTFDSDNTTLHTLLKNARYEETKFLLKLLSFVTDCDDIINKTDSQNQTALHLAIECDQCYIVKLLVELKANPNTCDEDNWTSLHVAISNDCHECLYKIINANIPVDLEAKRDTGYTALHMAVKKNCLDCVKALIEAGADINSTTLTSGKSALHIAAEKNCLHVLSYLVTQNNLDINLTDSSGNTVLDWAVNERNIQIIHILENNMSILRSSLKLKNQLSSAKNFIKNIIGNGAVYLNGHCGVNSRFIFSFEKFFISILFLLMVIFYFS